MMRPYIVLTLLYAGLLTCTPGQAVTLSQNGLGQVLIYPYYTARGGNDSLISVVNTTDDIKALKIRFREAWNSRDVLSFNIYLDARDSWSAAVTDIDGAPTLLVADSSCTVPYFQRDFKDAGSTVGSQIFSNLDYSGRRADSGPADISRAAEGFIEVIEMGVVTNAEFDSASAIRHAGTPQPADCDQLLDAWTARPLVPGYWAGNPQRDIAPPSGGLLGQTAIINPDKGRMVTYPATAIAGFYQASAQGGNSLHTFPGSSAPDLNSGNVLSAEIPLQAADLGEGLIQENIQFEFDRGVDAVSAVLMKSHLVNEFNVNDEIGAASEWVFTFPTRQFYTDPTVVNNPRIGLTAPLAPFGQNVDEFPQVVDEMMFVDVWNRDSVSATNPDLTHLPPCVVTGCFIDQASPVLYAIRGPVHVLAVAQAVENGSPTAILGSVLTPEARSTRERSPFPIARNLDIGLHDTGFISGHAEMTFEDKALFARSFTDTLGIHGLPVLGFWVESFVNNTLQDGDVLANYAGIFPHRSRVRISRIDTTSLGEN